MITLPEFGAAESLYVIANTPTFLASKLREDAAVKRFSERSSSEDILEVIEFYTGRSTSSLRDRLIPLVMLVALSVKRDRTALQSCARYDLGTVRWFHDVLDYLLQVTKSESHSQSSISRTGPSVLRSTRSNNVIKL